MRLARAMLVGAALWLSLGAAVASGAPFSASSLSAVGDASVEGSFAAVYAAADARGLDWSASAAEAAVHRAYANYSSVVGPFHDEANAYTFYDDATQELSFGASTLVSTGSRPGGAILVLGLGAPTVMAATRAPLSVAPQEDPRFVQGAPDERRANGEGTSYTIDESVSGAYLNLTAAQTELVLRGDFQIHLSGVDYRLSSGTQRLDARTGYEQTGSVATLRQGHVEKHVVTLTDATLRLRVPGAVTLVTHGALLTLDGEMRADDPRGTLRAEGGSLDEANPAARVRGGVALTPEGGAVAASAAVAPSPAGAHLAEPAVALAPWALLSLALASLAAAGAWAWRRRERVDPVQAALLAMEERRWDDALPHLHRALARRPDDVALLVDRAICLESAGRPADARADYERALRRAPDHAEAHLYYARALAATRDLARALDHLDRALALDPRLTEIARRDATLAGLDHGVRR